MSKYDSENPYAPSAFADMAVFAAESERTAFIRRTYLHVAAAISLFIALETLIFTFAPAEFFEVMFRLLGSRGGWLIVLLGFMGVSWIANTWAASPGSRGKQYAGLILYTVAETLLFVPLLYLAKLIDPQGQVIESAALLTGVVFGGLTALVFITKADFSWLGRYLALAGFIALGLILCSMFFNVSGFGMIVIGGFIALASGYILYDTSNVLHHYRTDQHVAAALALFASVMLLFWYMLQLVMSSRR